MFSLALVVIAASVLSVLILGLVVPIWSLVDCAISKSDTAHKVLWIVAIILTGGVAAIAYALISRSSALKRTTAISLLTIPAMAAIVIFSGMTMPVHPRSMVREFSKSPLSLSAATKSAARTSPHGVAGAKG